MRIHIFFILLFFVLASFGDETGPTLHVSYRYSTSTEADFVIILSTNGTVWCTAVGILDPVPEIETIRNSPYTIIYNDSSLQTLVISNLEPDTRYSAYCYAEDTESTPMSTSVENTREDFVTEPVRRILTVGDTILEGRTLTVPMTFSMDGTAWCGVFGPDTQSCDADTIKAENHSIPMEANVPNNLIIQNVSGGAHEVYCYAETQEGEPMTTDITETRKNIFVQSCLNDCGFGTCDTETQDCICFNGFSKDSNQLCTIEDNTYRLLIPFTTTVDLSTEKQRKEFNDQVILDLAAAVHLSPSRFSVVFTSPSPLMVSIDLKPTETGLLAAQAYIWRLQELEKNESSQLYHGVYTQYIDKSTGIIYNSIYHSNSNVVLDPPVVSQSIQSTNTTELEPIQGTFTVSSSSSSRDVYLYNYEIVGENTEWLSFGDLPTSATSEGSMISYTMDPSLAQPGLNHVSLIVHSLSGDSSMITFVLILGTITGIDTCDDISQYTGFDMIIALFQTYSFVPGLIIGLVGTFVIVLILLICLCCCSRKKTKKAGGPRPKKSSSVDSNVPEGVVDESRYFHELQLVMPNELSQYDYQQKWDEYKSTANWTQKVRGIPKEGKLEDMLSKSYVACSSTTFMANMNKYHFYGQDEETNEFILADVTIDRPQKQLTLVVKGPHPNFTDGFIQILQKKLARLAPQ